MNRYRLKDLLIKLIYSRCFFHSVFAPSDSNSAAVCLPRLNYSIKRELSEVRLSPTNILKQLQSLYVNKASVGLPSKLLQACATGISPSLCRLFNLSLELEDIS